MNANSTAPLTASPIRLSDIEFNTLEYEREHGHHPKGYGSWAFVAYEHSKGDYLPYCKWFNGMNYGQAKRAAAWAFREEGVMEVVVCT